VTSLALAAVDLGASSGRVILGQVGEGRLELRELHRFRNGPVRLPGGLYWDVLGLYQDVLIGLRSAVRACADAGGQLRGLAIDAWAVDYGLLDGAGTLMGNPHHYRDSRTEQSIGPVHQQVGREKLYATAGLQFLPFNTLYQFAAEPELAGRRALLIPDLLGYWLTGQQVAEETNASTTGLLDARTGDWSAALLGDLGLPAGLLPPVAAAGQLLGPLRAEVRDELGSAYEITATLCGSHDTASAVAGVPAQDPGFAYISCGTWGLVGVELTEPILTETSRLANFTNERGVDGTIRYLRNVMGLWLLSESIRIWALRGQDVVLADVLAAAAALPPGGPVVDPDDPAFLPPGDMPARIEDACRRADQPVPQTVPATVRCILDSLAVAFARTIDQAEALSGHAVRIVHLVGGGSQNQLLCQLTADAAGRTVVAGPVEATAIGNLLVQARTHGALKGDLSDLRALARPALTLRSYQPRTAR
jgi:rhamnulokinase